MWAKCTKCCPCFSSDRGERAAGPLHEHVQEGEPTLPPRRQSLRQNSLIKRQGGGGPADEELATVLLTCQDGKGGTGSAGSTPIASPISVPVPVHSSAHNSKTRGSWIHRRQTFNSIHSNAEDDVTGDYASCFSASEGEAYSGHAVMPATGPLAAECTPLRTLGPGNSSFGSPQLTQAEEDAFRPLAVNGGSTASAAPLPPATPLRTLPPGLGHFPKHGKCPPKLLTTWAYDTPENIAHLGAGGCLYNFLCSSGSSLPADVLTMMRSFVHLSSFDNPEFAAPIDVNCAKDMSDHIFIVNKAQYVLPAPLDCARLTPEFFTTIAYQKGCQPKGTKFTEVTEKDTFRMSKPIIPFIVSVTIQFRVSIIPEEHWPAMTDAVTDGLPIHHALLLERTKRDMSYKDVTRTVKSVLLYHRLQDGGLLVTNVTCVANSAIPTVVAKIIDSFGTSGAKEVAETATRTRAYLMNALS
eukprot:TRINITY_DN16731_c0_g1_i1.p1 TRINITY_DN16731_c0_g1~~TRINITY_DN16731_c0_g1_i1.p1  ORF type:complete len:468 (+),score=102.75 TRINITY_DN16731_c0_g1_i1:118-1521(+)